MKNKTIMIILLSLALLGLVTSIYLTTLHYKGVDSICDFNQQFSCTDVSRSAYAKIFSIPVSILGMVGYAFFAIMALLILKNFNFGKIHKRFNQKWIAGLYFYVTLLAFLFSLYLTYIELNAIHVICPLCLLSQIIIIIMVFFSYLHYKNLKLKEKLRG
ncbi:MAG: vitamin K epoxide reductase family protein [archaeon]|nr:vitamin K epoxide reductase family protein [Nanoarchaeota archaeon]